MNKQSPDRESIQSRDREGAVDERSPGQPDRRDSAPLPDERRPLPHGRGSDHWKDRIYQGPGGQWRLTIREKKRILLNNIYGVDIDAQAVEVTKLSLLLKVLEGETAETVGSTLRLFHERALPDLSNNIKCGNSLIGPDFYEGRQLDMFDEEERYRINAFDWQHEFPEVFPSREALQSRDREGAGSDAAGFDAVIGNPPYGAAMSSEEVAYSREIYDCAKSTADSFAFFIEKGSLLLRVGGHFGMIVQSAWVSSPSTVALRDVFVDRFRPLAFATLPYDVFGAYIDTIIVIAERLATEQSMRDLRAAIAELTVFPPKFKIRTVDDFDDFRKYADAGAWLRGGRNEFLVTLSDAERSIIARMEASGARFSDVADIQRGVTPFHTTHAPSTKNAKRAFTGTVRRYRMERGKESHIRYDETLAEYKPERYFKGPRLLLRELISRQFQLQAVFTKEDFVTNKSMQSILLSAPRYDLLYLLGLLNSKLLSWYFLAVQSVGRRDDFPKIVLKQTRELPFPSIDFSDLAKRRLHDRMVSLVRRMLDLHKRLPAAKTDHDKTVIQRDIEATDRVIDRLVYELYGLTEENIRIVEEATA